MKFSWLYIPPVFPIEDDDLLVIAAETPPGWVYVTWPPVGFTVLAPSRAVGLAMLSVSVRNVLFCPN